MTTEFTKQQTFDMIVKGLIEQGRPAFDGNDCRYRTNDGCKCAAGQVIPDEKYDPSFEGLLVRTWLLGRPHAEALRDAIVGHDTQLLASLQSDHDRYARETHASDWNPKFVDAFTREARATAAHFGLDASICDWRPEGREAAS